MSAPGTVIDVSGLPTTTFGLRSVTGWATVAFMTIEGTTLAVALATYFYLRRNFPVWPPPPTPLPSLAIPTANLVVLLVTIVPMWIAGRAARKLDLRGVRAGLLVALGLSAVAVVLRFAEFRSLNTHFDSNAYGSCVWVLVALHYSLLLVDLMETAVIAALTFNERMETKHFSDVEDAALYQVFLSLSWVPIFVTVFLVPRLS
ncbi:MAG TPA: cytochrome c oxidase subunit 3 [Gammaproteobacteria bacterium]|nr:cytochrome c oxidase subunit 3 [Gammaproteobacteria bacterium]